MGATWFAFALATIAATSIVASGATREDAFFAENQVAMTRMMTGMAIKSSGDVDTDFATMMIPHHQGAIDMALAELHHGRNETLRRIAQGIVVQQQQEISALRLELGRMAASHGSVSVAPTSNRPRPAAEHD